MVVSAVVSGGAGEVLTQGEHGQHAEHADEDHRRFEGAGSDEAQGTTGAVALDDRVQGTRVMAEAVFWQAIGVQVG